MKIILSIIITFASIRSFAAIENLKSGYVYVVPDKRLSCGLLVKTNELEKTVTMTFTHNTSSGLDCGPAQLGSTLKCEEARCISTSPSPKENDENDGKRSYLYIIINEIGSFYMGVARCTPEDLGFGYGPETLGTDCEHDSDILTKYEPDADTPLDKPYLFNSRRLYASYLPSADQDYETSLNKAMKEARFECAKVWRKCYHRSDLDYHSGYDTGTWRNGWVSVSFEGSN